ncbi:hypothetical protein GCM10009702_08180 [Propioniferax innocua]
MSQHDGERPGRPQRAARSASVDAGRSLEHFTEQRQEQAAPAPMPDPWKTPGGQGRPNVSGEDLSKDEALEFIERLLGVPSVKAEEVLATLDVSFPIREDALRDRLGQRPRSGE